MSVGSHIHTDDIIVDADVHFTIDPITRTISNQNADKVNKKLTIMQYDNKSERYSFDIDRLIDGHDLMLCNRVQIHFINIGSNKQKHPGLYLVDDVHVNESDNNKITFTWLISQDATQLSGLLSFAISFECVNGEDILYRWSTTTFNGIQITAGMDNDNTIVELYTDELLAWENHVAMELSDWQNNMENEVIPNLVDECYIERDFATSEEVAYIFDITDPDNISAISIDDTPIDGSSNLVKSGGVKLYVDNLISALEARISALE